MELSSLTILQAHQGLLKKKFSAIELAEAFFKNIEEHDKKISAFLTLTRDFALTTAKEVDDLISQGHTLPILAGIPLAIKDNILVEGIRCTAGSKILENYIAPYDATVIKKLKNSLAVFLGKTNLDEFAMGSSTERSAFGPTKNPHDTTKVPGGSSGGSAAAVAADFCCAALGSDTGGSIRQPAAFCGVVGLKPTYGAVSRYGLIAMASSLDQIGPITKTVEDAEILFDAIKGKDEKDSTSVERKNSEFRAPNLKQGSNSKFRIHRCAIGIPKEYFIEGMDSAAEKMVKNAIKTAEELGANIEEISLPHTKYALAVYYIIMPSEVSANLARYDGIKYGASLEASDLFGVYLATRGKKFGEEVKRRIMLGTYTLSAGYYDAYYVRAQKVRTLIQQDFQNAFQKVDFILTPTTPTPAFDLGAKLTDPLTMYLSDIFTIGVNLAGLPALSLPVGKVNNLPVGLQIIGKPFCEKDIFAFGKFLETVIPYNKTIQ
jgi:aspartyl-tRNA(Asn)/glutamyl-tRNA(Gln) amidotransferase subunit A